MLKKLNIAVLSYNDSKYSETFIQNQVKHLEGNIHLLYGGDLPQYYGDGEKFLKENVVAKVKIFAERKFRKRDLYEQHLQAVEKYLLQHKIDVVLANYAVTAFPIMHICKRNDISLIVHFHGWTAYRKSILERYKTSYPELFEIATAVIAVSFDMKQQLERLGAPDQKIHVLRCGADQELFQFTDHVNNSPVFFSPGRFCETKKPQLTIQAFYMVLKKIPDAKLVMAGGDEGFLGECVGLVKQLGIESRVEFRGIITHPEVCESMKNSAALVLHSVTTSEGEKEGTPVTLLEAALSGLPIIATRHAGIAEVFKHEKSALLCEEFDINMMAENMISVISDKVLSKNIAQSAHEMVKGNFTLGHYITVLNEIMQNSYC